MKTKFAVLIAIFASVGLTTGTRISQGQTTPVNLVQNGGAEIGADGQPSGWQKAVFPASMSLDNVDYLWHAKIAHAGKRSLCFKKTDNRFFPVAQWTQTIAYSGQAQQLKATVWIKTRGAKKATLTIACRSKDGANLSRDFVAQVNENGAPVTQDWKRYEASVAVPSGTSEIVVSPEMYGPGVVWFDDITLAPVSQKG